VANEVGERSNAEKLIDMKLRREGFAEAVNKLTAAQEKIATLEKENQGLKRDNDRLFFSSGRNKEESDRTELINHLEEICRRMSRVAVGTDYQGMPRLRIQMEFDETFISHGLKHASEDALRHIGEHLGRHAVQAIKNIREKNAMKGNW